MAIHATLQDSAGQRLELVRRKKRKDALLGNLRTDIGEVALDEPRFTRYFGSITPDLYRAVFGFTHADLQQGAELLQIAGLGELLGGGALGGGAEVVRRVLGDLRDEADALFKTRGKNPPINRNLGAIRDARTPCATPPFNSLSTSPSPNRSRTPATRSLAPTPSSPVSVSAAQESKRSSPPSRTSTPHQRLLARLADPELATPLHPADAERVRPLFVELRAREQRHQTLADELERLERRAAQHPVDHPLLAESAAVERLVRRVESVTTRRRELPRERERLNLELAALRAEFSRLSGPTNNLSQETSSSTESTPVSDLSPETALAASPAELEQIRLALGRWRRTRQELQVLARGEADDEAELAALRMEASALTDQAPDERGASLLAELGVRAIRPRRARTRRDRSPSHRHRTRASPRPSPPATRRRRPRPPPTPKLRRCAGHAVASPRRRTRAP